MTISTIIDNVIRFRVVVLILVAAAVLLSAYSIRTAPLDAIPDISDPQIVIYVKWPRSPQLLEAEVTEPIIRGLIGSPDVQAVRGTSHMLEAGAFELWVEDEPSKATSNRLQFTVE